MKYWIWERSFAKILFRSLAIIAFFYGANVCAMGPAFISVVNPNDLRITKLDDDSESGTFRITIYRQPKKCSDGSLELKLQIETTFSEKIKYDDKEIEESEDGKIFCVTIPKTELRNKIFYKKIELESNNPNYKFEEIKLKIEPSVEIFADSRMVDFGKIEWDGHGLIATNSPSVKIHYTILKDAVCEIKSDNNFRLKHKDKDEFISYSMNGITENGDILLPSDTEEYIANFKIENTSERVIPYAGGYKDKITLTIKTDR